jgi:hypothetical protein
MTQTQNSDLHADALVARYHAAQAELDAHGAIFVDSVTSQSAPSAQVRANIVAHAAQVAHSVGVTPDVRHTIISGSAYAHKLRATAKFDNKKETANDNQWKIRALASVAMLGLTGLLLMQWDRGTPEEKEIAFSMERRAPAPAAAPSMPVEVAVARTQQARAPATPVPVLPSARNAAPRAKQVETARDTANVPSSTAMADKVVTGAVQAPKGLPAPAVITEAAPQPTTDTPIAPAPLPPAAPVAVAVAPAPLPQPAAVAPIAAAPVARAAPPVAAPAPMAAARAAPQAGNSMEAAPARLMPPDAALFVAIRETDAASLQLALARGADKNARSNGTPAITLCVLSNQTALVRLLAAAGADLNAPDAPGMSPLAHAQAKGLDEMVKVLLELGAK